jgi:hypothetical protein
MMGSLGCTPTHHLHGIYTTRMYTWVGSARSLLVRPKVKGRESSLVSPLINPLLQTPFLYYYFLILETQAQFCRAFPSDWTSVANKNIGVVMRNSVFFSFYDFYVFSRLYHREGIILFIYYFGY